MALEVSSDVTYLDAAQTRACVVVTFTDTLDATKSATVTIADALIDTAERADAMAEAAYDHYKRYLAGDLHVRKSAVRPLEAVDTSAVEGDCNTAIAAMIVEDNI